MAVHFAKDDEDVETHDINVTPFIDVILVLLIIFMVAAPLATVDIPVELPSSTAEPQRRPDKPVFLSIKSDRSLAVGEETIARESLAVALDTATKGNREEAARMLGIGERTLYRVIQEWKLQDRIKKALSDSGGNTAEAAKLLGIKEPSLQRKMKKWGLVRES